MLSYARIWPSVSRYLEISFGLRGPSPQAFTPFRGGLGSLPGTEAPLTRGMPTGPRVFLANSGRVWATALHPVPPKKGLVPYMPIRWGVHQIPQINLGLTPLRVSGSTSAGRVILRTDLAECVSVPGDFLRSQGAFPPGFYLLREGWVNRPAPEAPLIRGMPTGP